MKQTGAQMAVCNYRQVNEALQPIKEQYLHVRREVLTTAQALERSTLLPYMVVWNKLYHKSIFDGLRFAEGKVWVDEAQCVGCGLCAKECPVGVIHVPAAYAQQVMSPAQEEAPAANA